MNVTDKNELFGEGLYQGASILIFGGPLDSVLMVREANGDKKWCLPSSPMLPGKSPEGSAVAHLAAISGIESRARRLLVTDHQADGRGLVHVFHGTYLDPDHESALKLTEEGRKAYSDIALIPRRDIYASCTERIAMRVERAILARNYKEPAILRDGTAPVAGWHYDLAAEAHEYFTTPERRAAEEAGYTLFKTFESCGVHLGPMSLEPAPEDAEDDRPEFLISLGSLDVRDARSLTLQLEAVQQARKRNRAERE
ncbi:hypothetical protein [Streptomyces buecherae]|uniref:hypothetical protein n=1 Tax=Streptomyces buecherae TaxID=2763006 RepID=UPI00164D9B8D|nr:hypothetical protein [Streptomyces buecherae]QNJ42003.1 hypothetical protein H7H31_21215 [Streptomyces buecherae]